MAMESEGQGAEQDSDYDGAWKEAIRYHLPEFLATYLPDMHATIDWSIPAQWFDKELSQMLGTAGSRNKRVDMLVKVHLRSGQLQWILLHLEIQFSPEAPTTDRPDGDTRCSLPRPRCARFGILVVRCRLLP
ncbi:MAG: hypothetical protein ACQESR_27505 [Planctomycetota bacterium]